MQQTPPGHLKSPIALAAAADAFSSAAVVQPGQQQQDPLLQPLPSAAAPLANTAVIAGR